METDGFDGEWRCCLSGQLSLSLNAVPVTDSGGVVVETAASNLEDALDDRLCYPDEDGGGRGPDDGGDKVDDDEEDMGNAETEGAADPVTVFLAEDAHLLRCRRRPPPAALFGDDAGGPPGVPTAFGLIENAGLYADETGMAPDWDGGAAARRGEGGRDGPAAAVSLHRPRLDGGDAGGGGGGGGGAGARRGGAECGCVHPRGDWSPFTDPAESGSRGAAPGAGSRGDGDGAGAVDGGGGPAPPPPARVRIVDLTEWQASRRQRGGGSDDAEEGALAFDTTLGACHLLRSVLRCFDDDDDGGDAADGGASSSPPAPAASSHCASPWHGRHSSGTPRDRAETAAEKASSVSAARPLCQRRDAAVALLVRGHLNANEDDDRYSDRWDRLEQAELRSLLSFRTGDAAPSYYLHGAARMTLPSAGLESVLAGLARRRRGGGAAGAEEDGGSTRFRNGRGGGGAGGGGDERATLLVYRHLPPRDHVTVRHPLGETAERGLEDVLEEKMRWHCRWEAYIPPKKDEDDEDGGAANGNAERPPPQARPDDEPPQLHYRLVAPPYQSHSHLYPSVLDEMLRPANLAALAEEARSIPQWTAWPETTHYSATPDGGVSWTVFPLCHTFPADDPSKRKWISKTCRFVPQTARMLRSGKLGEAVRTALFSRLAPGTNLGAHTGWADLANHVLRVHIPLVVPGSSSSSGEEDEGDNDNDPRNAGLCGTWVDGCVETHSFGVPVVFDDSRVHRAFNYGDGDRIVLIVDLARPGTALPGGTATGGHTEELDGFIRELT